MPIEELLKLVKKGRFDEVESAWTDAIGRDGIPWQGLLEVADALARRKQHELLESLLWYLITELRERGESVSALRVAAGGCALMTQSDILRNEAIQLYQQSDAGAGMSEQLVAVTLGDAAVPLDVAVRRLEKLKALPPGSYVRADPGAQYGKVEALNEEDGTVTVRFERATRTCTPAEAEALQIVDPQDFHALALFEKGRMSALALDDPEQLVLMALQTFGGRIDQNRLKLYVTPLLGPTTYAKWWSGLRKKVEHSPTIGLTAGAKPDLFLRSRPQTRQERLRREFDDADPMDKLAQVLSVLREKTKLTDARRELFAHFAAGLAALAGPEAPAHEALAALAAFGRLAQAAGGPLTCEPPGPWLQRADLQAVLCRLLPDGPILDATMDALKGWLPERWRELYASALPQLPRLACEKAARDLADAEDWQALRNAAQHILRGPDTSPGAILWLWKAVGAGACPQALDGLDPAMVLRQLMSMAAHMSRGDAGPAAERKQHLNDLRRALLGGDRTVFGETMGKCDEAVARSILALVERSTGFTAYAREELFRFIASRRPELARRETRPWEEQNIYTTEKGMETRRRQLEQIVNERLPQVIREVGEAARLGDLSENAEFDAAVNERARLAKEAAAIREEIAKAKPISAEMACADHVSIGTRVRARNLDTGLDETFTFLGPWEADVPAGIYSYRAPVSLAFMGKKVQQEVTFGSPDSARRWQIVEILPAPQLSGTTGAPDAQ